MTRVGDRERERAVATLKAQYVKGRLSVEELADRMGLALTARRDHELRLALAELPVGREQLTAAGSAAISRARRAAFVAAVWFLWCATSLVLLIGFVASLVVQGVSLATALVFFALWLVCTVAARRATRGARSTRR
jgi:hypothetical protein